jgi:hypothetical protein
VTVEEIGRRLDALGLWDALGPYHWAIKPRGTAFPYFVCLIKGDNPAVKIRLLLLEGWQTFHDFVRARLDRNYGFYLLPIEFPHYELVILASGEMKLFRHDAGYVPQEADERQRAFSARLLWEVYGVMMRIETDRRLPLRFADDKAVFARIETAPDVWTDEPLEIPEPRAHVERVTFKKADIAAAKDLPLASDEKIDVDFRFLPGLVTREARPRCVYALCAVDGVSGERLFRERCSVSHESGLRGMWESLPPRLLTQLIARGRLPGEIRLSSGRLFRLLRMLCTEIPFKLSLHDRLPLLDAAFDAERTDRT